MSRIFPPFVVSILFILLISGCVQQPSGKPSDDTRAPTAAPSAGVSVPHTVVDGNLYTISRPSDWEAEKHESFVYLRPPSAGGNAENQENVVIYVAPAAENQTLVNFFEASVDILIETTPGFALIEYKEETLSSVPAYKIVYTEGEKGKQYLQIFTRKGGKVYIITYAAPQETYTKYAGSVEDMIRSFNIK